MVSFCPNVFLTCNVFLSCNKFTYHKFTVFKVESFSFFFNYDKQCGGVVEKCPLYKLRLSNTRFIGGRTVWRGHGEVQPYWRKYITWGQALRVYFLFFRLAMESVISTSCSCYHACCALMCFPAMMDSHPSGTTDPNQRFFCKLPTPWHFITEIEM